MRIALSWLREYVALPDDTDALAERLTAAGLEVEHVETAEAVPGGLAGLVVGEVLSAAPHPNADKLRVTTVDVGQGAPLPIVCGAPNVAAGQKVVVATVGTTLYPTSGEPFKIKKAKIRGEVSQGMICAEDEIGLGTSHDGIIVLEDNPAKGTPAAEYFDLPTETIFEIGLTPNRADAASHFGVARDVRALYGSALTPPDTSAFRVHRTDEPIDVVIDNPATCPRYAGLTISGVTVRDSPDWLQERLRGVGLTPVNNIVDVTNYVLHGLGQPLHAFDADRLSGQTIRVGTVEAGTVFETLDGQVRTLSDADLMICDAERPVCIAGVFGGAHSGVTEQTRRVFVESAYFHPDAVRRTAQRHGLKTDASFRFERGVDPNAVLEALKLAALLMVEVAGGEVASEIVDGYPAPIEHFPVRLRYRQVDRLAGYAVPPERIREILERLDIEAAPTEDGLLLRVPPYRVDVQREVDVIEEVLRVYGYNQLPLPPALGATYLAEAPSHDPSQTQRTLAQLLVGMGYSEIMTNSLTRPAYAAVAAQEARSVPMLNPLSEDLSVLRQSLLFTGLESVAYNLNRRQDHLRFFEFGRVYARTEEGYAEEDRLALFVTGRRHAETWRETASEVDFHTVAEALAQLLAKASVAPPEATPADHPHLAYGLAYRAGGRPVGHAGRVSDAAARATDVRQPVFYAEIDWAWLSSGGGSAFTYQEVSRFPEVRRDLSLVLDEAVAFSEVERVAYRTERKLLRAVNVFDVYQDDNLGDGKKSYAVSFLLQAADRTLTDQAIDKTMQRLMKAFERELNATIRT